MGWFLPGCTYLTFNPGHTHVTFSPEAQPDHPMNGQTSSDGRMGCNGFVLFQWDWKHVEHFRIFKALRNLVIVTLATIFSKFK